MANTISGTINIDLSVIDIPPAEAIMLVSENLRGLSFVTGVSLDEKVE